MRLISSEYLDQLLFRAKIRVSDTSLGIGRELSYLENPCRIVVIHVLEDEPLEYVSAVMACILEIDKEWLLLTRYGSVCDLGLLSGNTNAAAISFSKDEQPAFIEYLCTRLTDAGLVSADLYVLGENGKTLVTWNHHTADEGIVIQLRSVADTTRLLVSLNELGTELDVFYSE